MESKPATSTSQAMPVVDSQHTVDDTREMLRQIHEAVIAGRRSGGMQALTAVILSLATLTSTWCGYQAARWSGVQSELQSAADTAERQAAENTLAGLQIRTQDGLLILEYWRALRDGDERTTTTMESKMRPELQRALKASIREGILEKSSVAGPLQREEYRLDVEVVAGTRRDDAKKSSTQAVVAGQVSSEYVLLTLMLASVLFVGGVSTTFSRKYVRRALSTIALLVFAVAVASVTRLPVLWPALNRAVSNTASDSISADS
jgi:hypothetical protein